MYTDTYYKLVPMNYTDFFFNFNIVFYFEPHVNLLIDLRSTTFLIDLLLVGHLVSCTCRIFSFLWKVRCKGEAFFTSGFARSKRYLRSVEFWLCSINKTTGKIIYFTLFSKTYFNLLLLKLVHSLLNFHTYMHKLLKKKT